MRFGAEATTMCNRHVAQLIADYESARSESDEEDTPDGETRTPNTSPTAALETSERDGWLHTVVAWLVP